MNTSSIACPHHITRVNYQSPERFASNNTAQPPQIVMLRKFALSLPLSSLIPNNNTASLSFLRTSGNTTNPHHHCIKRSSLHKQIKCSHRAVFIDTCAGIKIKKDQQFKKQAINLT